MFDADAGTSLKALVLVCTGGGRCAIVSLGLCDDYVTILDDLS